MALPVSAGAIRKLRRALAEGARVRLALAATQQPVGAGRGAP
jgi:hypothetical protein